MASANKRICRYCGSEATGYGCQFAPNGIHVAIGDDTECVFCHSSNYGYGCQFNRLKIGAGLHKHGHSSSHPAKCIWCGSTNRGNGCQFSPTGKHEF